MERWTMPGRHGLTPNFLSLQVSSLVGKNPLPHVVCMWKFACLSARHQLGTHPVVKVTLEQPVMEEGMPGTCIAHHQRGLCMLPGKMGKQDQTLIGQHLSCKKGEGRRGTGLELGLDC